MGEPQETVKTYKRKGVYISPQTVRNHRKDKMFKSLLWSAVVHTMLILVFIVGYVIFRGVWYRNKVTYDVTNFSKREILVNPENNAYIYLVINKKIKVSEIDVTLLNKVFNGDEYEWGNYSGQDLELVLFTYRNPQGIYSDAVDSFLAPGDRISEYAEFVDSEEQMIRSIESIPGAFGYINASTDLSLDNVKIIGLRRLVVGANPMVTALIKKDVVNEDGQTISVGRRLNFIKDTEVKGIFSGEYINWQEVGGPDQPIVPVFSSDPESSSARFIREFFGGDFVPPADALFADSDEKYFRIIKNTTGAFGLCTFSAMTRNELEPVPVKRIESGINLTLSFLAESRRKAGAAGGIRDIIINTLLLIMLTLIMAAPLGIMAAVYFIEYAGETRLVYMLRMGTDALNAIPSIIFGLFGYLVFVQLLKFRMGLLSGSLTMTMMILPTIIRTSEEALKAVPQAYREGSLALGATKWQTIIKVVIPAAAPGILNGIILGMGRAIGETAALMYTMGTSGDLVGLFTPAPSMSVHLYYIFSEGISKDRAFATAAILILIVLIINFITTRLVKKMSNTAGKY